MNFIIKQPETEEEFKQYYHLRWEILRHPWGQAEGSETDDIEDECLHLIATDNKNSVIAVARLQFNSSIEAQIRYMAVAKNVERNGIGRELINTMEQHANKNTCKHIILDAREHAVGFYEKLDYKIIKKSYYLFNAIQHYQMIKKLR